MVLSDACVRVGARALLVTALAAAPSSAQSVALQLGSL